MTPNVQVGTILIEDRPIITQTLGLESESYSGNWGVVKLNGSVLERKIRSVGWNCFFLAEEVKSTVFGSLAAKSIQKALKRICLKVRRQGIESFPVRVAGGDVEVEVDSQSGVSSQ
jgi:hypothetical protein